MNPTAEARPPVPFDYAPVLESATSAVLRERYGLFIGGEWVSGQSGAAFASTDPTTEVPLAEVAYAEAADVDRAVRAARRAYDKYWRKLRPSERAKYLYRLARALGEHSRDLAVVETLDSGKPIREARDFDLPSAAASVFYNAGWADKLEWAVRAPERARALGVVAAIVPSGFPLLSACSKIAPALACGNTVVLKPAEATSLSTLRLASLVSEADLPPGVFNLVTGDARTEVALAEHPDLDKVSFTGSTAVGKQIRRGLAGTRTRLGLELEGKSALIVFEDAALDQTIEGIVTAVYLNRAHAGSRVLVQESVADELVARLRERLETLRVGNPLDANTDVGPLVSRSQRDLVTEHVRRGQEEGAAFVARSGPIPERGFFFTPGFFAGVQPSYRVAREDIFGPVLALTTFRTSNEAIALANDTPYGLGAGVWTSSGALALHAALGLRAGVVWAGTYGRFDPSSPFGGYKESGFGREGGVAGLRAYLDI